jgi:hypothetical protein
MRTIRIRTCSKKQFDHIDVGCEHRAQQRCHAEIVPSIYIFTGVDCRAPGFMIKCQRRSQHSTRLTGDLAISSIHSD